jgi:hypothetical protein
MRKFTHQVLCFTIPIVVILLSGLILPPTPRASKSLVFASLQKDSLLQNTKKPRIIFIGGSNLSFGLNSQMVKDSLHINPINTGLQGSLGLIYMMNNAIQYVREGDIIILVPEYQQFYGETALGGEVLLRTIFDVNRTKRSLLNIEQQITLIRYIPKYSLSKFDLTAYFNFRYDSVYGVNSFNEFGDTYTHWDLERQKVTPFGRLQGKFNHSLMQKIIDFRSKVENRNAVLFFSYPGYQDKSYNNSIKENKRIECELKKNDFKILGFPERYMLPDSMMFNTPYHLSKAGVDYRTSLFIEDYIEAQQTNELE